MHDFQTKYKPQGLCIITDNVTNPKKTLRQSVQLLMLECP